MADQPPSSPDYRRAVLIFGRRQRDRKIKDYVRRKRRQSDQLIALQHFTAWKHVYDVLREAKECIKMGYYEWKRFERYSIVSLKAKEASFEPTVAKFREDAIRMGRKRIIHRWGRFCRFKNRIYRNSTRKILECVRSVRLENRRNILYEWSSVINIKTIGASKKKHHFNSWKKYSAVMKYMKTYNTKTKFDKLSKMLFYNAHMRLWRSRCSVRELYKKTTTKVLYNWKKTISDRIIRSSFMVWKVKRSIRRKNISSKSNALKSLRFFILSVRKNRKLALTIMKDTMKKWNSTVHKLSRVFRLWKLRALLRLDMMSSWAFLFEINRIHNIAMSVTEEVKKTKYVMKRGALDFLDDCLTLAYQMNLSELNVTIGTISNRAKTCILSEHLGQKIKKRKSRPELILLFQQCVCLEACVSRIPRFFLIDVASSKNVGDLAGINPEFRWYQKTIIVRKIASGQKVTHVPNSHDDHHINSLLSSVCVWKEEALRRWQFTMCCADTRIATIVGQTIRNYDIPACIGFEWVSSLMTRYCKDSSIRTATGIQRFWEFRSIGEDFKSVLKALNMSYEKTGSTVPDRTLVRHRLFLTSVLPKEINDRLVSLPEDGISTLDAFGTEYKCKWCKKNYANDQLDVTNIMLVGVNMFCTRCLDFGWTAMDKK